MSDYTDVAFKADGYSKGSYTLYGDFNYRLRYFFDGGIYASFGKVIPGERADPGYSQTQEFNLHWRHAEDFDPTAHLQVDFTFTSGSYYQNTSFNLAQLLMQNVVSNATFTKSWDESRNSMNVNISRDQNLTTGQTSTVLPDVSFNRAQTFPFRSSSSNPGTSALRWYELISFTYGGEFKDVQSKTLNTVQPDSGGFSFDERRGIQHSFVLNMSPKVGYVTLTPFFNYTEKWYDEQTDITRRSRDEPRPGPERPRHQSRPHYNLGLSAGTKFYGIFQPNILGIKGIRHQVTPSLSYTYAPDFSADKIRLLRLVHGHEQDRPQVRPVRQGSLRRRARGEQQALSFSVGNVFEMKTVSTDTSGQDNKFQLLNLNAGISYNFAADSLRFSELSLDYRTAIGQYLSIGGSTTYNLYKFVRDTGSVPTGRRINRFLLNTDHRLGDLTGFTLSIGTRLSGEKKKTTRGTDPLSGRLARQGAEERICRAVRPGGAGFQHSLEPGPELELQHAEGEPPLPLEELGDLRFARVQPDGVLEDHRDDELRPDQQGLHRPADHRLPRPPLLGAEFQLGPHRALQELPRRDPPQGAPAPGRQDHEAGRPPRHRIESLRLPATKLSLQAKHRAHNPSHPPPCSLLQLSLPSSSSPAAAPPPIFPSSAKRSGGT